MTKLIAVLAALAVVAIPAVAIGQSGDHGKRANPGRAHHHQGHLVKRVAHRLAAQECRTERKQTGKDAFRAKYGPKHAFRHCVRQHAKADRAKVRTAAKACRAERKSTGKDAFRAKYNTPHAFRNCVRAHLTAPA